MSQPIVPSITDEQLAKLERLSDGANQSGWYWDDKTVDEDGYTFIPEGSCLVGEIFLAEQYEGDQEDCNFIEAAKPAVIKSLIARLRAAEKDAARYRFIRSEYTRPGFLSSDPSKAKWLDEYLVSGKKMDAKIDLEMERDQ